jgi:SNF2 family DNA or RNA helicase
MGLGKTIQTIAFLCHLKQQGVHGPFLVIGPLNTLDNWTREFKKFAPTIHTLLYHGTKPQREEKRKKFFKRLKKRGGEDADMPVIVTRFVHFLWFSALFDCILVFFFFERIFLLLLLKIPFFLFLFSASR